MTEFRTKGKGADRKVYPLSKKRTAFGVSRNLAYKEVEALRKEGKRARLIKTNQKLDLYAPYVSTIPPEAAAAQPAVQEPASEKKENEAGKKINIAGELGILNSNGKPNLNLTDIDHFYGRDSMIRMSINDGKLSFLSIDPNHIAAIREIMETDLPNGYLEPTAYGTDFTAEWVSHPPPGSDKIRWPDVKFNDDTWNVRLEGESLKSFLNAIRTSKDEAISFGLSGDEKKASISLYRKVYDKETGRYNKDILATVNASTNRPVKELPSGWTDDLHATFPREYLEMTVRTLLGRKAFLSPKGEVLTLKLRADYPIEISTRRIGHNGEHIQAEGLIAPRMGDE